MLVILLQVLVLFTAKVNASATTAAASEHDLAYVQYYKVQQPKSAVDTAADLTMTHLVWEQSCSKADYAVVPASSILQRVCLCPHFKLRSKGKQQHYLVNDFIEQPVQFKAWHACTLPMFTR